jgi:hypothetical protein
MITNIVNAGGGLNITQVTLNGTEEGICVTNDSKVGVGIANPQRSLEVAGDLVVGGTISGGAGMGGFRNRIINGDMRIAQRGTSNVMAASAVAALYMVDRFLTYSSITSGSLTTTQQTLTASDTPYQLGLRYSLRYTITSGFVLAYLLPTHTVEGLNIADLMWGTSFGQPMTMSFWLRTNLSNGSMLPVNFRNGSVNYSYNVPVYVTNSGGWQYVTFTVPPPPNGSAWTSDNTAGIYIGIAAVNISAALATPNTWQNANYMGVPGYNPWWQNAGNYIEFTGVQLEKGTVATPFEFRNYAQELALCQRYYWNFSSAGGVYTGFGSGYTNGTSALITVPFPVQMRAQPTQNSNSAMTTFVLLSSGASVSPSALTTFTTGLNSSILTFTVAGQTAGQGAILQANNTTGAFVAFGAEL